MQKNVNALFDLTQMYQTIGIRRLASAGVVMGIALAGQILVTILIGTIPWVGQHIVVMVLIELVWWPPFFAILYFTFKGVVKLVERGLVSQKQLRTQVETVYKEYEERRALYESRLQEQERFMSSLTRGARNQLNGF
jgi:hypothetical protein